MVSTEDEAVAAFETLGGAVVVKPLGGRQGCGVSLNLSTPGQVREAFRIARDFSSSVLVETIDGPAPSADAFAVAAGAQHSALARAAAAVESPEPRVGVRRPGRARANSARDRQGYNWR